jgi:hypothetical protein
VDFEVCVGGVFGVREWVSGRAFVFLGRRRGWKGGG